MRSVLAPIQARTLTASEPQASAAPELDLRRESRGGVPGWVVHFLFFLLPLIFLPRLQAEAQVTLPAKENFHLYLLVGQSNMAGRGKVLSWTTFHRGYFPEYPAPHTVIVLELDEGPLFVAYPVEMEEAVRGICLVRFSYGNKTEVHKLVVE